MNTDKELNLSNGKNEELVINQLKNEIIRIVEEKERLIKDVISLKEEKEVITKDLKELKEYRSIVFGSETLIEMSEVAKIINVKGFGRNKIFKLLRDENVLRYNNEPYQLQVDAERFKVIEQPFQTVNGETYIGRKTLITQKGLDYILKLINGVK